MDPQRVVFEKGITVSRSPHGLWRIEAFRGAPAATSPADVARTYGVRPVLLTHRLPPDVLSTSLLPAGRSGVLDQAPYEILHVPAPGTMPMMGHVFNASYMLGAVVYHCLRLAEAYAEICRRAGRMSWLSDDSEMKTLGDQPEPYYELEALISAAMRAYDTTLTHMIWWIAGGRKGQMPGSFEDTLPRCAGLPAELKTRLETSWHRFGSQLNAYRDCIHHYVQLGRALPHAIVRILPGGAWSTWSPIPDNPDARSQKAFRFEGRLDALTYGWELTTEVVDATRTVVDHLARTSPPEVRRPAG
jgi:hypothetical protein